MIKQEILKFILLVMAAALVIQELRIRDLRHEMHKFSALANQSTDKSPVNPAMIISNRATTAVRTCLDFLPGWVLDGHSGSLAKAINVGSKGLTDKSGKRHAYHIFYHRYLSSMVIRLSQLSPPSSKLKFRMLEIGLGCHNEGGMVSGQPGGSAFAWRHLFPRNRFDLDLHVMEYDAYCAIRWEENNPGIVTKVHVGDASSIEDLERVVRNSGGLPFDMIIDDGSHFNEHQIATFQHMIQHVTKGGIYVIEDIHSSCRSWVVNAGDTRTSIYADQRVEGTHSCMSTKDGNPTIFRKLVDWQRSLVQFKDPFPDVTSIDVYKEAVVISKQY